jgi:hypothetical protein
MHTQVSATTEVGSHYLVARVLIDLQEGLDLGRAVVLGEVHHLVNGDHHLPVVLEVLSVNGGEIRQCAGKRVVSAVGQSRVTGCEPACVKDSEISDRGLRDPAQHTPCQTWHAQQAQVQHSVCNTVRQLPCSGVTPNNRTTHPAGLLSKTEGSECTCIYLRCSTNSGASLFITKVCAEGRSMPSICQPSDCGT